jgi:hypothetical protein
MIFGHLRRPGRATFVIVIGYDIQDSLWTLLNVGGAGRIRK